MNAAKHVNLTAIVIGLYEQEYIETCICAIYPYVQRIIFITNYDTDYSGASLRPDLTLSKFIGLDDPDRKLILLLNRRLADETIQRNWGMLSDRAFYSSSRLSFKPHTNTLEFIREQVPKTDYFWIIDGDEIYDPETIPAALEFLSRASWNAVTVRGHCFFKKWNYRIVGFDFCQIGFLRAGVHFHSRRSLYIPRPLGWLYHLSPHFAQKTISLFLGQTRLPDEIACFYHGYMIGDEERIQKKWGSHSHADEVGRARMEDWIQNTWRNWTPQMKDFWLSIKPEVWPAVEHIPTSQLPRIIREGRWPEGWIEK